MSCIIYHNLTYHKISISSGPLAGTAIGNEGSSSCNLGCGTGRVEAGGISLEIAGKSHEDMEVLMGTCGNIIWMWVKIEDH